jgi:benzoyl-CoA-dihydrodiol lyase
MADAERKLNNGKSRIDFQTDPSKYRHWKLEVDGDVATLLMDVDEKGSLFEGYELKLNSYDLGVDIELADAIERLRFEHPQVKVILLRSGKPRVFCAGANIRMLAGATHAHKVNFCKFTNETRNGLEDASEASGLSTICVINGTAAGGGYELALAADHIMLIDDGSSAVSLPELPLLAVLPGTGGLTRVTDKRKVRRDRADVFCTTEEGIKGKRAVEWRLVDEVVPGSKLEEAVAQRAKDFAAKSSRAAGADGGALKGIALGPLKRERSAAGVEYGAVSVEFQRVAALASEASGQRGDPKVRAHSASEDARKRADDTHPEPGSSARARLATITLRGPDAPPPTSADAMVEQGAGFWPLQLARELDDAILDIRANEFDIAVVLFKSSGDPAQVLAYDQFLDANKEHWLAREIRSLWKRTLKRVDLTSRSLVTLVEPGSCFAGTLAELVFASDRSYMLIGKLAGDNKPPATLALAQVNFGAFPMCNGLSRLASRFLADPADVDKAKAAIGKMLDAEAAQDLGLVTFALDDIDWEDEIRVFLEERASFSADGLTGLEANLRFGGPETMESKIFARLTAWQNWIFQRPNAVGEEGALKRYGSGQKPTFDTRRV